MGQSVAALESAGFRLRFGALSSPGRSLTFPCDAHGNVDLDALDPRAVDDYLYARAMIGREFAPPTVQRVDRERC